MNSGAARHRALAALAALCLLLLCSASRAGAAGDRFVAVNDTAQSNLPAWESTLEKAEQALLDKDPSLSDKLCADALAAAPDDTARATIINQMGVLQMKQKRYLEAKTSFTQALELRSKCIGEDKAETLQVMSNLALATQKSGNDKEAEDLYNKCIERKRAVVPNSASLAKTLTNLANLYSDERRCEDAKKLYKEALDIDTKSFGSNHEEVASDQFNLGALLYRCNECTEALSYFGTAKDTYTTMADKYGIVKCLHYISLCHAELKNYDKAAETSLQSLALHEELNGKGNPDTLVHMLNAAQALDAAGSADKAEDLLKQALQNARSVSPPSNERLAECNLELAQFYREHRDNDKAEQYFKNALVHYDELTKKEQRKLYEIPQAYSELLHDMKKKAKSEEIAHRYLQVYAPGP